jgi:hypothetical protein
LPFSFPILLLLPPTHPPAPSPFLSLNLFPNLSLSFLLSPSIPLPPGGTINGETSLKEFFYPESGIYRFKPGEGLARCTRYVISDLGAAFPSTTGKSLSNTALKSKYSLI